MPGRDRRGLHLSKSLIKLIGHGEFMIENAFNVRYIKLHFTIEFREDAAVPVYKASALRGGMGEMLLRANCISDRNCDLCEFEKDCLVRRIMYPSMDIQPSFMSSGESIGYVIECEDYHDFFFAGDTMSFNLVLFGKSIVCFSQFLNAFYALGMSGLGKELGKFGIVRVTNSKNEPILAGDNVIMANYKVMQLSDYISYRKEQFRKKAFNGALRFQSPTTITYKKEPLKEFRIEAVIEAICRRIYMLDCFEGIESNIYDKAFLASLRAPAVYSEQHNEVSVRRFSNHKKMAMYLKGIEGELRFEAEEMSEVLMDLILAGELTHIGKNTSFGFGRYKLK